MTARLAVLLFALLGSAAADTLYLKDGTKVSGRWWSIDGKEVHFLVDNQFQHYPRTDVTAVTFGDAPLPSLPTAPSAPTATAAPAPSSPATAAQAPANAPAPSAPKAPPSLARPAPSLKGPPQQTAQTGPPTLSRSGPPTLRAPRSDAPAETAAPASAGNLTEPEQTGVVYFRASSGGLTPLERTQAVERRRGSTQYWEMPNAHSPVRLKAAPEMQFVVRLAQGTDPESFGLYPMAVANNARRTQNQPGRRGGPVTVEFDAKKTGDSVFTFTVRGLAAGEYSFSPSGSNDAYCFGVDAPGL